MSKTPILNLDNRLKNISLSLVSIDDYLSLMLIRAIGESAQAIHLKPKKHQVQYFNLIGDERYEEIPIPGFRIYNELKSRAQNPNKRRFTARYQGKNHLVNMSIRVGEGRQEILELKIAA